MKKTIVTTAFLLVVGLVTFSQEIKSLQDTYLEADYFFMKGDYKDALPLYLSLCSQLPDNANLAFKAGVCYLNIEGKKNLSISYLETASRNMSSRHKEGTITQVAAPYDALFELGNAYRVNYQFDKAKDAFGKYRETLLPDEKEDLEFVDHEIKVCENAARLIENPVDFTLENMGDPFNNAKANFNPVISADGKTFVFMVSEKFYDAVMITRMVNNKWTTPANIIEELRSDGDLYISCLSADGKVMYLSKDDDFNSDLWTSNWDGKNWSPITKLNKNINTKYWESHGCISEDGNWLVFASDRPGGTGGLDLYISKKEDGDWGPAVNMGPELNSVFNEDRPFLLNNGKTIFFASQDHNSMGGYDIFRSDKQSSGIWSKPVNLGYPINTPDDNIFFMPTGNGKTGFISLQKDNEGFGDKDIYKITIK
ncbi:MAG: hypothetical protein U0X39_15670 [Bacteroidales bacterium]